MDVKGLKKTQELYAGVKFGLGHRSISPLRSYTLYLRMFYFTVF